VKAETLTNLLRLAIEIHGNATLRRLQELVEGEERVRPRGLTLNRTTASQILRGTYRGIASDGTIRAVAWLAGVPDERAYAAAGREAPGPPFVDELPPGIDTLTPRERGAVIEVAKSFMANRDEIRKINVRYGERLVHVLVQLGAIQRAADAMASEDIEPDLHSLSEALDVLAYDLYLVGLEAYGGDDRRLRHQRLQIAMDSRASGSKLSPVLRADQDHADDATASRLLDSDTIETIGLSWDWSTITTSLRSLRSELYRNTERSGLVPHRSDPIAINAVSATSTRRRDSVTKALTTKGGANSRSVVRNPNGGWDVKKPGSERAAAHASTQSEALDRAREILRKADGDERRVRSQRTPPKAADHRTDADDPEVSSD
jgi:Uncharacterized protein conserved in bacteria (DUF2188)